MVSDMQHRDIDGAASALVRAELAKVRMDYDTLAAATGIPRYTLSRRINQRRTNNKPAAGWRVRELVLIARALGLPWDAFIAGIDENNGNAA